ncbi:DUF951 domain-containing protein [Sporosalibacterium faouarense]|uniref:DUF951 domain-containing protein n=1 Tax=Sporosalibacterium faouarense TaxID=516123 RepID=UPI00141C70C6|nr:DUF951 domain-containing protein [Sporosalibacterium faouarense]MTI46215.1 DUF951 domain-containing protein [Bacillota bacterium]
MQVKYNVGDVVQMKKAHPCGENRWEVMRIGVDFRIKCLGCGRQVWVPRRDFVKKVKKILSQSGSEESK